MSEFKIGRIKARIRCLRAGDWDYSPYKTDPQKIGDDLELLLNRLDHIRAEQIKASIVSSNIYNLPIDFIDLYLKEIEDITCATDITPAKALEKIFMLARELSTHLHPDKTEEPEDD